MTSHAGLTSPEVREKYSSYTDDYRTFRTLGLSRELADEFLDTPEGENYWRYLAEANPDASSEQIDRHAIDHLRSGREFPRVQTIDEPLAKIVPCRRSGSPRSSMPPASTPRCASTKRG